MIILLPLSILFIATSAQEFGGNFDVTDAKCEVCKIASKVLIQKVEATDPKKVVAVGSFRLQADGSTHQKKVIYRGSEQQLQDFLDDGVICEALKEYVPVTDKRTGKPQLIDMVNEMHRMSEVLFNPDPDFNSKMNTLCVELLGEHEDILVELFQKKSTLSNAAEFAKVFCIYETGTCSSSEPMDSLLPPVKTIVVDDHGNPMEGRDEL